MSDSGDGIQHGRNFVVITLRNFPRGENSRDVTLLTLMRLILHTEFEGERLQSPLVYNNLIVPDHNIGLRAPNRPEAPVQSGAERRAAAQTGTETANKPSDTEENGLLGHVSASVEDSGEDQPLPSRTRRKRRKRKCDKAAGRPLESSSGNEHHHLLRRRRTQTRSGQGHPRTGRTLAGRERHGRWQGKEGKHKDAEEETLGLLQTRRTARRRPARRGLSPSEEPVPGPSGKKSRLLREKGKEFQLQASAPSTERREASRKEPPTGERRKRKRAGGKGAAGASTTDSEEAVQPKPPRRRKKKD